MQKMIFPAVLSAAMFFAGCAHHKQQVTETGQYQDLPQAISASTNSPVVDEHLIVTLEEGMNGKVSSTNPTLRFVVLTFPVGHMPAIGRHLSLYRRGLKVAEISVTGPQREDSIVADIVAGEAEVGDEVRVK
jgi:hypothetical protein